MSNPYAPIGAIKLERTAGIPTWEAQPGSRHHMIVDQIRASIAPLADRSSACMCYHLADVAIRFPDGSLKRPDIAVFCEPPPAQDTALTVLPVAVIEVISAGYE